MHLDSTDLPDVRATAPYGIPLSHSEASRAFDRDIQHLIEAKPDKMELASPAADASRIIANGTNLREPYRVHDGQDFYRVLDAVMSENSNPACSSLIRRF